MQKRQFNLNVLAPAIRDQSNVRLGGYGPTLPRKGDTADVGKVRVGGYGPTLPRKS
jgi:hypothetical protein